MKGATTSTQHQLTALADFPPRRRPVAVAAQLRETSSINIDDIDLVCLRASLQQRPNRAVGLLGKIEDQACPVR